MKKFNLKKGLDIPVLGIPRQVIDETKNPRSVAIVGPEYNGLKPKMLINVDFTTSPLGYCSPVYPRLTLA